MSKKKKTILIIVSIICVWLLVGIVDFSLVHNYHKPIFSLLIKPEYQDGGSGHYVGLGYSFDIEGNFISESDDPKVTSYKGYIFGKEVSRGFWERMLIEDDKNKLIYGDNDVLNLDDNEIVINNESGENLEINKEYIENIAKENCKVNYDFIKSELKCKVNYEYVKSEISGENTKWVVEFYEDNAMLPAQTIILEKDGTIIENWYSE